MGSQGLMGAAAEWLSAQQEQKSGDRRLTKGQGAPVGTSGALHGFEKRESVCWVLCRKVERGSSTSF